MPDPMTKLMSSAMSHEEWDRRFREQLAQTYQFRKDLFKEIELSWMKNVLDVGCGTGRLASELVLYHYYSGAVVGLDIDPGMLGIAPIGQRSVAGTADMMPFRDRRFEGVFCNYLLLWMDDPEEVVAEMARVCKREGWIGALSEPDYSGAKEDPHVGRFEIMREALIDEGADPDIGSRLGSIFKNAGLEPEVKCLSEWQTASQEAVENEWNFLMRSARLGPSLLKKAQKMRKAETKSAKKGRRRIYMPVYAVWAQKPAR